MARVSSYPLTTAPGTFYTITGGVPSRIVGGTMMTQNANAVAITGGTASLTRLDAVGTDLLIGNGVKNALRITPLTNALGVSVAATDSTGAAAYKPLELAGTTVNITATATGTVGSFTNTGLNACAVGVTTAAAVNATGYSLSGTAVVGTRKTGWAAATGTATRTTFATSTVTLPQLAERVKALLDDLISHGLIGA